MESPEQNPEDAFQKAMFTKLLFMLNVSQRRGLDFETTQAVLKRFFKQMGNIPDNLHQRISTFFKEYHNRSGHFASADFLISTNNRQQNITYEDMAERLIEELSDYIPDLTETLWEKRITNDLMQTDRAIFETIRTVAKSIGDLCDMHLTLMEEYRTNISRHFSGCIR